MATIAVNNDGMIQFVNFIADASGRGNQIDAPTLVVQSGEWQNDSATEAGVVFDVAGDQAPILDSKDARKLAKWLQRAADILDGTKNSTRKNKARNYYEDEDDDFAQYT